MDNLFVLQAGFDTVDQIVLKQAIRDSYKLNCDGYLELPDNANVTSFLKKQGSEYTIVPVGSIEFAAMFLGRMQPIEVPETLRRFCRRDYQILKGSELPSTDSDKHFFKDASKLKSWNSLLCFGDISRNIQPDKLYVFSEKVEFEAEYRIFVYKDEILGVQRYLGCPTLFPKEGPLHWMVNAYREEPHPEAYTLDIGVRRGLQEIIVEPIEVHPFVSCGLYGFDDFALPAMLAAGARWYREQNSASEADNT